MTILRVILKIIITGIVAWFYLWIVSHEGRESLHEKSLSKKEKQYLTVAEGFTIIIPLYIIGEIWGRWD